MADELRISSTEDTPEVTLERSSGVFKLSGRSLPEDAFWFYNPIIEWLSDYAKSPLPKTEMHINLEYFNTASAKQVFKLLSIMAELGKTNVVLIKWHYDDGDKDMLASGQRFSKLCNMAFDYVVN